jgi:hypothetical protein
MAPRLTGDEILRREFGAIIEAEKVRQDYMAYYARIASRIKIMARRPLSRRAWHPPFRKIPFRKMDHD